MNDLNPVSALVLLVILGIAAYNTVLKIRIIGLLAWRSVTLGTLRGYWSDVLSHCAEGKMSAMIALPLAAVVFVILVPAVLLVGSRRAARS